MTVSELIEALKEMPQRKEVYLAINHQIEGKLLNMELNIGSREIKVVNGRDNEKEKDVVVILGDNND